ncbi:7136_t:CDS:2 [Ambispora leptoticha]|uniref:7136_t:CDS:1 n=1 Tax=Ambispora leptoticha TaxID=144679 RepID=A0A9N9CLF9_9GLOM|nr:7136_t:CDS:2 [Ambispora leptoticha]
MSTTEEKSTPWSTYFNITLPEDYSFLEIGSDEKGKVPVDWKKFVGKEPTQLREALRVVNLTVICVTVMGHRKYFKDVDTFWNQLEASNSVIQDTTEVFKNSISSVNSAIKNVNNTVLKYNGAIKDIENVKPNSGSVLGKRQNSGSSGYDSSTESDGNEIAKKKQARKKAESITDNNSDGEELANTLGYDGFDFSLRASLFEREWISPLCMEKLLFSNRNIQCLCKKKINLPGMLHAI